MFVQGLYRLKIEIQNITKHENNKYVESIQMAC